MIIITSIVVVVCCDSYTCTSFNELWLKSQRVRILIAILVGMVT